MLPFQLIIITIGFMSAGFIIKTALMEWSDNPVITTLGHCPMSEHLNLINQVKCDFI